MENYTDIYSRIWGDNDIGKTISVTSQNNSLTFKMNDDTEYTIFIAEANYGFEVVPRISGVVNNINQQFGTASIPIKAYVGGVSGDRKYDCIVFHPQTTNRIKEITGSFMTLFNR